MLDGAFFYGIILYLQASKALKLSCEASWTCIMLYCKCSEHDHRGIGDLSNEAIVEFINEACTRSAFYLDLLDQRGSKKVEKVILTTIRSWSVAHSNFSRLRSPMPLVKQWAKASF